MHRAIDAGGWPDDVAPPDDTSWDDPPAQRRTLWVSAFALFFVLQDVGAFEFLDRLLFGEGLTKAGDPFTQGLNLVEIVVSVVLLLRRLRHGGPLMTGEVLALSLAGFMFASVLWSFDPATSLRRGFLYVFFMLGVIGIAGSLSGDEYIRVLRTACLLAAVISVLVVGLLPDEAPTVEGIRGVFATKNKFGEIMAIGILATLHLMRMSSLQRWFGPPVIGLFVMLLFGAKSATAVVVAFTFGLGSFLAFLLRCGGALRILALSAITALAPCMLLMIVAPGFVLGLLGKDPTLTGRTELWDYVVNYIYQKPILGWGVGAFWIPGNQAFSDIASTVGWVVVEAHNGLLEMLLELGLVGSGLILTLFVRNIVLASRSFRGPEYRLALTALLCYCGVILMGVSEEVIVDHSGAFVNFIFISGLICERSLRPQPVAVDSESEWHLPEAALPDA